MKLHTVTSADGIKLHVREWGTANAPAMLFIHGWSQNHLCWQRQYESELADSFRLVAFDLRGHGMSDAPAGQEHYTAAKPWADDVAAIIDTLNLDRPLLVGWSYGGFIICDYVRVHGQQRIAGINFVGAAVTLNQAAFGTLIGPGFLDHVPGAIANDFPSNVLAIRQFVRSCTVRPLAPEIAEAALCWNIVVSPAVRAALVTREIDSVDMLSKLERPVLVTHGKCDTVVLPAMGDRILNCCGRSTVSWYEDVGHAPFLEEPDRFNRELSVFASGIHAA